MHRLSSQDEMIIGAELMQSSTSGELATSVAMLLASLRREHANLDGPTLGRATLRPLWSEVFQ